MKNNCQWETQKCKERIQKECRKTIGQTFGDAVFLVRPEDVIKLGEVVEQLSQTVQDNQAHSHPLEAKRGKKTIIIIQLQTTQAFK